jgi:hypothetical protein
METPDSEDDKKPTASNEAEEKNDSNEDDTEIYKANPYGLNNTTKEEVQAVMDMWHQHNLRFFFYHCNGQMMKKAGKWKCTACDFSRSSMEIEEIQWRLFQYKRCQNIGCKEQTYENSIQCLLTGYMREEVQMTHKNFLIMSNFYHYLRAQDHEHEMWSHLMWMETYFSPPHTLWDLPEKLVQWKCPQQECPSIQRIAHSRYPTCMHEPPPALKYLIKKYPEEMYNCCYQLSGPTVDEYGLQQTGEAWMEHNEESLYRTECYRDKSEREVARELRIPEEINAQSYYLANGGENDEPGAFFGP